jgi:hypothetical protein
LGAHGAIRSERGRLLRKAVAAAALAVIFGCVVFTMPAEQLAWQGSYVMGALLLPDPAPGTNPFPASGRADGYPAFSLLGFFSVLGIIGLAMSKAVPGPGLHWMRRPPQRYGLGPHWGLLIHHNVRPR